MSHPRTLPGLVLGLLLAAPLGAGAAEEVPAVVADFTYASRHVFRGVERAGPSAQAAVDFNRDAFSAGLWSSVPFDGRATRAG